MKLICGTSSEWRQNILTKAGFTFEVVVADIDEKAIRHSDPYLMPKLIAKAKADAIFTMNKLESITGTILMTCDQITLFNDTEVREKPQSEIEARKFLRSYSNNYVSTGRAVFCVFIFTFSYYLILYTSSVFIV